MLSRTQFVSESFTKSLHIMITSIKFLETSFAQIPLNEKYAQILKEFSEPGGKENIICQKYGRSTIKGQ